MLLLVVWVFAAAADSAPLQIQGLSLNEKLKLQTVESHATGASLRNDNFEVQIRSFPLPNKSVADQKAATELGNLQNLYKPRRNPYVGQVSELVECGKDLVPKTKPITVSGTKATLLAGGASARKIFGVCAKNELEYWGGYFQFFHEPARSAVEVRVFIKKSSAPGLQAGMDKLAKFSQELFR